MVYISRESSPRLYVIYELSTFNIVITTTTVIIIVYHVDIKNS